MRIAATTGYARRYAMWLLNHPRAGQHPRSRRRQRQYGPDVQHALFLLWHAANRICTKRLMPFLPTLIEALERHEHLHITEECRNRLLSMSVATADRLLSSQRKQGLGLRGIATTRAGTFLKNQIPIRTFQTWNPHSAVSNDVVLNITLCSSSHEIKFRLELVSLLDHGFSSVGVGVRTNLLRY